MPQTVVVELFSPPTNNAIIRMPGRAFPGVLIQGDTLASLVASVREIESLTSTAEGGELRNCVVDIRQRLEGMLSWYEQRLLDAGLTLPYERTEKTD